MENVPPAKKKKIGRIAKCNKHLNLAINSLQESVIWFFT